MARLTSKARAALPAGEFALPSQIKVSKRGKKKTKGAYPIPDRAHAGNAKARVSAVGSPAEKATVDAAVARKFPNMGKKGK